MATSRSGAKDSLKKSLGARRGMIKEGSFCVELLEEMSLGAKYTRCGWRPMLGETTITMRPYEVVILSDSSQESFSGCTVPG